MLLTIKNLIAHAEDKKILNGVDLQIPAGETHILMGRNGSGKSTLLGAIMRSPRLSVNGKVEFDGRDISTLPTEQIASAGIFLGPQTTPSIEGLSYSTLLKHSANALALARGEKELLAPEFFRLARENCALLGIPEGWLARHVGEGFSGGEKKRLQMLLMLFFKPRLAMLDEPDSGVDVEAIEVIAKAVKHLAALGTSFLIVSHYDRLIKAIAPHKVHVMQDGLITRTGGPELAAEIDTKGFGDA